MATYLELLAEPEWKAEVAPPNLKKLGDALRAHYGLTASAIGYKGDNRHLKGAHRSRRWIKNSAYCTNRTYTVSRTPGDRSGGDDDWLAGLDATLPRAELIAACARLDAAVRAGRLEKITEWYGNDDGDTRVDGYDNIANRAATSDSSHLWHLHITFDRGRANEDHSDLLAILTGTEVPEPEGITHVAQLFTWKGQDWVGFGTLREAIDDDEKYHDYRRVYGDGAVYPEPAATGKPSQDLAARTDGRSNWTVDDVNDKWGWPGVRGPHDPVPGLPEHEHTTPAGTTGGVVAPAVDE
jgi:hypothetical protein